MTPQFGNRIEFETPNGFGRRWNPLLQTRRPTVLVGIQRDTCPPFTLGGARLQRMRIIVVAPEQGDECFDAEPKDLDQESLAEVLPFLPPPPLRSAHPARFQPRPVLGEILRGEDGTLYERFGNRIRPLRRLVSGPDGELLETAGGPEGSPRLRARVAADPSRGGNGLELERDAYVIETEREQACVPPPKRANAEVGGESVHGGAKTSFHPLFPEPGQWRVVRLGDFKPMLVPQIAHPERLRDVHRLPCYVQVFEITAPQRIEAMAEAIFDDSEATSQLRPLTPAIVHQLQLAPLLPAPVSPIPPVPRQPGLFRPGDRVFCLEIANDPTDDAREKKCSSAVANEVRTGKSEIRNQKWVRASPARLRLSKDAPVPPQPSVCRRLNLSLHRHTPQALSPDQAP